MRLYLSYELRCHHLGPTLLFNLALQTKKSDKYGMVGISSLVCDFIPVQNHDTRFARVNVISDLFRYSQTLNFDLGRDWRVRLICG